MRALSVFNNISLDGYFCDAHGDMTWAHAGGEDAEFNAFVSGNAGSDGTLVFGRVTYEMMASYWPTPMAAQAMPAVAAGMNAMHKIVFSRTLKQATWNNTRLLKGDLIDEMRRLKQASGSDMVILGSGTLVAQLAEADLIDGYQVVINPVVLGAGRTMFAGLTKSRTFRLKDSRAFANGKVVLSYSR